MDCFGSEFKVDRVCLKGDATDPIAHEDVHTESGSLKDPVNVKERFSQGKWMVYHSSTLKYNCINKMRLNKLLIIAANCLLLVNNNRFIVHAISVFFQVAGVGSAVFLKKT